MASTTAFACAYCQVKSEGKEIIYIPFEMQVLCPEGTLLTLDALPVAKMMHLERIERPIADMITPLLAAFIREKGREQPEMSSIQLLARAVSLNTDFISVLHRDPRFKHLSIIAYPVIENDGKKTVRATVFDLDGMTAGQEINNPLYPKAKFKLDESLLPA